MEAGDDLNKQDIDILYEFTYLYIYIYFNAYTFLCISLYI